MTDLDRLRAMQPPRAQALCNRLGRKIDQTWGFVAYGVLWFFGASVWSFFGYVAFGVVVGRAVAKGGQPPSWVLTGARMVSVGVFVAVWLWFAYWVRQRRGRARLLFRVGHFEDGVVRSVEHMDVQGSEVTRVRIDLVANGQPAHAIFSVGGHGAFVEGDVVPVLYLRDYSYCAGFPSGALTVGSFSRT